MVKPVSWAHCIYIYKWSKTCNDMVISYAKLLCVNSQCMYPYHARFCQSIKTSRRCFPSIVKLFHQKLKMCTTSYIIQLWVVYTDKGSYSKNGLYSIMNLLSLIKLNWRHSITIACMVGLSNILEYNISHVK